MIDSKIIPNKQNIPLQRDSERDFYKGKTVLVTGAGGSVGGVLTRKLSEMDCCRIILFDICENTTYELYLELVSAYPDTEFYIEIGSVCDTARLSALFERYKPEIVFHAAAHKHVSLMEENCAEAIKNNCIGTLNVAKNSEKYECARFVLVSTDKAVRPTGVMGASKRVCEMLLLKREKTSTEFCAVRFGNVFGSAGSVIPIFKNQLSRGGPLTVTDKRIVRYFISLEDAASLLLCAGAMAKHGELYVLDMGKPCKIYDIAKRMAELYKEETGIEVDIVETGLRPGEKLYEEYLLEDMASYERTANDLIFVEKTSDTAGMSPELIEKKLLETLADEACESDGTLIKRALAEIIPDYTPYL